MLFTWDTTDLCIVFRSWRITGLWSLIWSLAAVAALTAGYEAVREASRRYEAKQAAIIENLPSKSLLSWNRSLFGFEAYSRQDSERSSLLPLGSSAAAQEKQVKVAKAAFYGVQVFYSFFIM